MVALSVSPTAIAVSVGVGGVVAAGLDRLYARLGYHEQLPGTTDRTRIRMVGYGLVCALAVTLAAATGLWLPLVTLVAVLAVATGRELRPPPEFVPIQELEPSVGPDADATVVEDGLVLAALLAEWHVWAPLALLVAAVEVGFRGALGWPLPPVVSHPLAWNPVLLAALAIAGAYPAALVLRRPWRDTSTGEGGWHVTAGFYGAAWGGVWLVLALATFLSLRHVIVAPLAVLVAVLVLVHLPPDEGDAPMELFLLYWPLGLLGVGLLAGIEWLLRL